MKFNNLIKYLEDRKKSYIKFLLKLYFKVLYPREDSTFLKFFKTYSFDRYNLACRRL